MDNVLFGNVAYNQAPKCMTFQHILTQTEEKVYNYIIDMVKYNKAEKRVDTPYYIGRQRAIADYLGYARETVNRAIQSLVDWGLIATEPIYQGGVLRYVVNDITNSRLWTYIQPSRRYPLHTNTNTTKTIELTEDQQKLRAYVNFKLTRNQVKILWQTALDNDDIHDDDIYNTIVGIYDTIKNNSKINNLHGYLKKCIKNYTVTTTTDNTDNNSNNCKKAESTIIRTSNDTVVDHNKYNDYYECKKMEIKKKAEPTIIRTFDDTANDTNENENIINSIYGKLIYDYPPSMHLHKKQVVNLCNTAVRLVINTKKYTGTLFNFVNIEIFAKIYRKIVIDGERSISNYYLYMLKMVHNYGNNCKNENKKE